MSELYPGIEPDDSGMLDVGDGHHVYWETCGNPTGKPAVVLHGGPGSGCTPGWRRYFDPRHYRIVLFDQRGCGRSTPTAADADLTTNTTHHLLADIERLRRHLGIDRWLVFGGSWGSTLGLAYAQAHPEHVSQIVLFSVVTTTHREVEWVTRDMGRVFPAEWARFRDAVPAADRDGNLAAAYSRLLHDPDPAIREQAARNWCAWEDTHVAVGPGHRPDPRYQDPAFRMVFARLVTHYWKNAAWLEDGVLLRNAHRFAGIPGVLVHGRLDISGPPDIAWRLAQEWPDADLVLLDEAGHGTHHTSMAEELVAPPTDSPPPAGPRPEARPARTSAPPGGGDGSLPRGRRRSGRGGRLVIMSVQRELHRRDGAVPGAGWSTARRWAGYGAALSLSLYLGVKIIWVAAGLFGLGPAAADDTVLLNLLTVAMSVVGIALGLALARPWGLRLPAPPLLLFTWTASGLLVSMLPFMLVSGVLAALGGGSGGSEAEDTGGGTATPAWGMALIAVGFAGMAAGLAVALPIYLRERWPHAFLGRLGDGAARGRGAARAVIAMTAVLAVLWLGWAFGSGIGMDPGHREGMDPNGRLLSGNSALWALAGGWSAWALALRRGALARVPLWVPMALGFIASGSLFSWGCWKLSMAVMSPGDYAPVEYPAVTAVQHLLSIAAGLAIVAVMASAHRARTSGSYKTGTAVRP